MFDFAPATREATRLLQGIRSEHLDGRTPCEKWPVVQVLNHLHGLSQAFTAGAEKRPLPFDGPPPEPDAGLPENWRAELPQLLDGLAAAWTRPEAWEGMTQVGGVDMPGQVCALVALDEVVVHSWDLAVATGQTIAVDPAVAATLLEFWSAQDTDQDDLPLRSVIFGEVVQVVDQATVFEQVLALTGRDPQWRAPAS
ncbi:TIGR03086 family metal-binding protein [Kineosporia babensis]|uniref:TIGR03086 family metal-binding protein n=1 Tax=Kineosporia babensis TaxID=499548 RepID=A0A9X1NFG8_9ACTN|nr:TIGR03086 family metal-binding protein [Kineosporia babensis]MCD5312914.1 TIGR03086 family metal-binding protein [Kineosporia babensis]